MFQLLKKQALIKSATLRTEKHGPKKEVPAITLRLVVKGPSTLLNGLDETLQKLLFRKPGKEEVIKGQLPQQELVGIPEPEKPNGDLTARKYKQVGTLPWDEKLTNYVLDIGSGLESTPPLTCENVTVSGFQITPLDGGFVELEFNASFILDEEAAGKLAMMQKQLVEISMALSDEMEEEHAEA